MRRGARLGLVVLAALLLYGGYDPGRSQPEPETDLPYDLEDRLQRLEDKLDRYRPDPAPRPPRPRRPTPPRPRPAPRAPVIFVPIVPPEEPPARPTPPPPPAPPRGWTWADVDRWRAFRTLAEGD